MRLWRYYAFKETPDGSLKTGDKVRVYGHLKTFENNKEFEFNSFSTDVIKIGSGSTIEPKAVKTGEATSDANQGLLVKVKGTVIKKYDDNSYVINNGSGDVLVFTDGYIVNQGGPVPTLKAGDTLEAVGLSGKFAEGNRIRVRDTKELVGTPAKAPEVTGVENNHTYNHDVTISFDKGTATLNGKGFETGTKVSEDGTYTLVVTDQYGNATTVIFTIDQTAPKVTGVADKGLYNQDVLITFNEGTATLNAEAFEGGTVVSKEGKYTLIVTDEVGNETTIQFTIDKTAPTITGVSDNSYYNKDVTIEFNNETATLNGESFESGTKVSEEGTYTLVIKDKAGNQTVVNFTIDKTAPEVNGVKDKGLYNHDVTVEFNELGALLNGESVPSGVVVSKDGNYTLTVTDKAGNVTTVNFIVDKTAPVLKVTVDKPILSAPNHKMENIKVNLDYSDSLSGIDSVVLESIKVNETNATTDDIQDANNGTMDTEFKLRSERNGSGNGRVYTITYLAKDKAGNTTRTTATVTVPRGNQGK